MYTRSTDLHAGDVVSLDKTKRLAGQWWILSPANGAGSAATSSACESTAAAAAAISPSAQAGSYKHFNSKPQAAERIQ